ncbi:MAG: glycosyltransferase family 39 protein, partial [Alcaligenaceae bacterium]|nr:glycosyltransferase family 39 protein [Alcaligenaceae bacterium]
AEIKTPGFLDYFIIGEHIRRFLDPGWAGDLYGSAHRQAHGTIWLYWLEATFPWGVLVLIGMVGAWRSARLRAAIQAPARDPMWSYWLAWAVFTPLFFTFSANILWTYLLPSIAAFSILTGMIIEALSEGQAQPERRLMPIAAVVPIVVLGLSVVVMIKPNLRHTERGLVRYAAQHGAPGIPLRYLSKPPFSARYYSDGKVQEINPQDLARATTAATPFYLAIPKDEQYTAAKILGTPIHPVYSNKRYVLIEVPAHGRRRASAQESNPPMTGVK